MSFSPTEAQLKIIFLFQISKLQYDYEERMTSLLPIELKEVCCILSFAFIPGHPLF